MSDNAKNSFDQLLTKYRPFIGKRYNVTHLLSDFHGAPFRLFNHDYLHTRTFMIVDLIYSAVGDRFLFMILDIERGTIHYSSAALVKAGGIVLQQTSSYDFAGKIDEIDGGAE